MFRGIGRRGQRGRHGPAGRIDRHRVATNLVRPRPRRRAVTTRDARWLGVSGHAGGEPDPGPGAPRHALRPMRASMPSARPDEIPVRLGGAARRRLRQLARGRGVAKRARLQRPATDSGTMSATGMLTSASDRSAASARAGRWSPSLRPAPSTGRRSRWRSRPSPGRGWSAARTEAGADRDRDLEGQRPTIQARSSLAEVARVCHIPGSDPPAVENLSIGSARDTYQTAMRHILTAFEMNLVL